MPIVIAKTAGFCMGVRRAVEMVLDASNGYEGPIYTYGPLIHNPQVLDLLKEKGISRLDAVPEKGEGTVLVRAHGVPPQAKQQLRDAGFNVIDATCPRVIKVQTIIRKHAAQGCVCIIVGDDDHAEVVGLLGYTDGMGHVVDSVEAFKALPDFEKVIIVAQTTQNTLLYEEIKDIAEEKYPGCKFFNTICDSTQKRQDEIRSLANSADSVIVVGGKESGNTRRLAEIAGETGRLAFHVETESDIDASALVGVKNIAITAGASTPNWTLKRVMRSLESVLNQNDRGWRRTFRTVERGLLLTNLYVSIGAGSLCYAATTLQGLDPQISHILMAALYVLSMHIFNNLTGNREDSYNEPDRAEFYNRHKIFLITLALAAGATGLIAALSLGMYPFLILLVMSGLGLSYNLKLLPEGSGHRKYRSIKDIPGSKTILIAVAWGVVTALLAPLFMAGNFSFATALAFIWASGIVFVRTGLFDIFDMQGDRIVGKETIPILIGEKKSITILKVTLGFLTALLIISALAGLTTSLGYYLAFSTGLMFLIISSQGANVPLAGFRKELAVESIIILTGVMAGLWNLLN